MKLSLEDAGPLFTVLVAASLGAALTFAAIDAGSRSTEAVVDLRFEFDARTYEVDRSIRVIRRPTRGLEGLVRDVESLREQQRVISELVRELPPPRP